ncbi:MAG: helix-turn-helix domain-containing protein [Opitutaceae bacterium]
MTSDKLQELTAARAKLAALEQSIAVELNQELAALPARYGFESPAAFIDAVRTASGKRRGRKPGSASAAPAAGKRKRKRAKITDDTRAEVKKLVGAGKSAAEIAKAVGISEPSVANIKKALGLVRKKRK